MGTPFVSLVTPTFGRFPARGYLLDELAYWYLRLDYPRECLEWVILSDCPGQTLVCDLPGVLVVNLPARVPTLGDKRNMLIDLAVGEIVLPQDDDDIPLPGRVRQAVDRLRDADVWDPLARWFEDGGGLHSDHAQNCTHHASAYRKHPAARYRNTSVGDDLHFFDDAAKNGLRCLAGPPRPVADWTYVYRWGKWDHISGHGRRGAEFYNTRKAEPGRFEIRPRIGRDYVSMTTTASR